MQLINVHYAMGRHYYVIIYDHHGGVINEEKHKLYFTVSRSMSNTEVE